MVVTRSRTGLPTTLLLFLVTLTAWHQPVLANPDIQHWETKNGARVYYVEAAELPMVDIRVVFDAGSARDHGRGGLAVMTNAMIGEGAGQGETSLDTDAIAERFDSVGASFSVDALRDMAIISLRSLTEPRRLQPAVDTLALVLNRPSFPADAFERLRSQAITGLRYEQQSPGTIASKAFYAALYGDHPYAAPSNGTIDSVQALTRQDLIDYYSRYYVARNALVAIVGKVDRRQAEQLAEQIVGTLPAGGAAAPLPPVRALSTAKALHKEHPSSQTHVLVGQPGMRRGDPDYFPLYVGNHILGGSGLVSRISDEVREKRGLAYSAYSYFMPMRAAGPFILGLQTRNDQTPVALQVLNDTLQRFVEQGPSSAELEAARKNITGGFALNIDSNKDIVGYLSMIGFYHLPLDYLDRFKERIEAVTLEQIKDAFRRRIQPDRLVTVTVGGSKE